MMKKMKQAMALLLCGALLLTALSGCNTDNVRDPVKEVLGYSRNTVYATINGEEITAEQYLFWLVQNIDSYNEYNEIMGVGPINWEEDLEGMTASDYVKQISLETMEMIYVIHANAEAEGAVISEEDLAKYDEMMTAEIEAAGGTEAYIRGLLAYCTTEEGVRYANEATMLYQNLYAMLCGPEGKFAGSSEELETYAVEIGLMQAKHILRLTADPGTGEPYSDEEIEKQRLFSEDILKQLKESDDAKTLFDELMHQYSEDTGLSVYPNGYIFQPKEMQESFESATQNLAYGEISDIVESSYGYHIILRLDPTQSKEFEEQYLSIWQETQMDALIQDWMSELEVETTQEYKDLQVGDFYEKLTEYRAVLDEEAAQAAAAAEGEDAKPEEEDAGEVSEEPDETEAEGDLEEDTGVTESDEVTDGETDEEEPVQDASRQEGE